MYISKLQIDNYKGFLFTEQLELSPKMNVIVGQNNSGKTAFLEAISGKFVGRPHKSLQKIPKNSSTFKSTTIVKLSFSSSEQEILSLLLNENQLIVGSVLQNRENNVAEINKKLEAFIYKNQFLTVLMQCESNCVAKIDFEFKPKYQESFLFKPNINKSAFEFSSNVSSSDESFIEYALARRYVNLIYKFNAERLNISRCTYGSNNILASDARNLAEVLNRLSSIRKTFERFNTYIRRIFPHIYEVTVSPSKEIQNHVEILVWMHDPNTEREDLAIPLEHCGTGIGQILAILYVVFTAEEGQVIVIDEPNSFLHPAASRELMLILKEFSQHQYIISTHSTEVIAAAEPDKLFLIESINGESHIEVIDSNRYHDMNRCLLTLGIRFSDIFGADKVLWVEGPTEELIFPKILSYFKSTPNFRLRIVAVKNTGDFNAKNKNKVSMTYDIYTRLTNSGSIVPPAVGFIFDREKLSSAEIHEAAIHGKGLVNFLPVPMIENYLLNCEAIAAVLATTTTFQDESPVDEIRIKTWIDNNFEKYLIPSYKDTDPGYKESDPIEYKLLYVNAAKLLKDVFDEFSKGTERFDKINHSVALAEWLLANKPEELDVLNALLKKIINS